MKRPAVYQHAAFDGPIVLGSNDSLLNTEVVRGGAITGNVLFTEVSPMVVGEGQNITIRDCYFWDMNGTYTPVSRWQRWRNDRKLRRLKARGVAFYLPEGTRYRLAP